MAKQRRRTSLAELKRAFEVDRERSGPTPPEAVVALYDAITGMIQMMQTLRCSCDEDDRETVERVEFDLARWCERRAELDSWDLCDVRAVLKNKDAWI